MKSKISNIVLLFVLALVSCSKDEDDTLTSFTFTIDATDQTRWVYFSFEKNDTVQLTEPSSTSKEWDIAFMRYMIKTNGGKSGLGQAAVYATNHFGELGIDSVLNVDANPQWVSDDTVVVYGYNPANPNVPTETKYMLNPVLTDWYTRNIAGGATMIISKKIVYVFRTANGKYAKFYIKNYYNDEGKSGYISIAYKYQSNGSTSFE